MKKQLPMDLLIPSDQILISTVDAVISIALFSVGLALIIGEKPKSVIAIGLILLIAAGFYLLLKNVVFKSVGCLLKKAIYTHDENRVGHLWLRVLLHNIVSLSPFIGLMIFPKVPYVFYFVLLVYLLNYIGYRTDNRRIIDTWLKISIVKNKMQGR